MKLVTGILPTRGRKELATRALDCFLSQTYPKKQLVIVDDAEDPSFEPNDAAFTKQVVYLRLIGREPIAAKRNVACTLADGEIVCHVDSDDWSAPTRIAEQVKNLAESQKAVTGYHSMLFYQAEPETAYWYKGYPFHPIGTSLMYSREWWIAHPFHEGKEQTNVGEDTAFGKEARDAKQIYTVEAGAMMVARIHPGNTSVKYIGPCSVEYRPVTLDTIPVAFFK